MLHCQPHCRGREAARFGHLSEAAADRSASAPCVRHRTESGTTCTARALCAHCRSVNRSLHCVHRDNVLKISAKRRISRARARLTPLGLSLLIASLGAVALVLPLGQALEENLGLSLLFGQRGIRPPPPEAVVVPIERGAADALGLANRPDQWPRALHARLIERLHAAGVAAIAFDIHFKEPRDGDDVLAAAMRRAGNVVLFAYLERDATAFAQTERLIPPTPILASAAAAAAPFALPKLPVRVNRYWAVQDSAGGAATLPLAALEQYSLPMLPAFAAALDGHDGVAAARLRAALASSPAAALAELRTIAEQASPETWSALQRALQDNNAVVALAAAYRADPHPYLNFYGPPRAITTVAYDDVINGDPATLAKQFRGKAVFVGFAEQQQGRQRDNFYTVFSQEDGLDLSGVEIAATAFANLLHRDSPQPPADLTALVVVLVYGVAIAVLCRQLPALAAVAAGLALAAGYYYVAAGLFTTQQRWLPLAIPLLLQTPLALVLGIFGHYWQSQRERRQLHETFGHYVPAEVIDRLLKHKDGLHAPGEPLYGICLATDAARYTQLAEHMSAADLNAFMNAYYETLFAPARARQGMISDVVGDAMLAIWTGPYTQVALRARAVDAALAIRDAAAAFCREPGRPALVTRLGLHCGELVMGNVGALDHFEYRAVGDIVNTANRIQSLNKQLGTQLLASAGVLEDIEGIVTRPLGRNRLAGKQQCVAIHEVLGLDDEMNAERRGYLARFAAALQLFTEGKWRAAHAAFLALQSEAPDDGPVRFFIERCRRYDARPPADWQGVLALAEK